MAPVPRADEHDKGGRRFPEPGGSGRAQRFRLSPLRRGVDVIGGLYQDAALKGKTLPSPNVRLGIHCRIGQPDGASGSFAQHRIQTTAEPPCIWASDLRAPKTRPVPSLARVSAFSTCANGLPKTAPDRLWKCRCRCRAPRSRFLVLVPTAGPPPVLSPPAGVYFTPLDRRLTKDLLYRTPVGEHQPRPRLNFKLQGDARPLRRNFEGNAPRLRRPSSSSNNSSCSSNLPALDLGHVQHAMISSSKCEPDSG